MESDAPLQHCRPAGQIASGPKAETCSITNLHDCYSGGARICLASPFPVTFFIRRSISRVQQQQQHEREAERGVATPKKALVNHDPPVFLPLGLGSCRYGGAVGVTLPEFCADNSGERSSMPSEAILSFFFFHWG